MVAPTALDRSRLVVLRLPYDGARVEMLTLAARHLWQVEQGTRSASDLDLRWLWCALLDFRDVLAMPDALDGLATSGGAA